MKLLLQKLKKLFHRLRELGGTLSQALRGQREPLSPDLSVPRRIGIYTIGFPSLLAYIAVAIIGFILLPLSSTQEKLALYEKYPTPEEG